MSWQVTRIIKHDVELDSYVKLGKSIKHGVECLGKYSQLSMEWNVLVAWNVLASHSYN